MTTQRSGNTPRARRTWDASPLRHPVRLMVQCKGRRILAAEAGDPARLTLTYRAVVPAGPGRGDWSAYVLAGSRFRPDRGSDNPSGRAGETRTIECPNHYEGHVVSGLLLREALDRLTQGTTARRVDVGDVVPLD